MEDSASSPMRIELEWLPPFHGPKEVGRTSAEIQIRFGSEIATRLEDQWSLSVHDKARASAYPLGVWLASSWWRIRWEPLPSRIRLASGTGADVEWRMSHELPAAGGGFIWPPLLFASDGETIGVRSRPSGTTAEPVRYLADFEVFVPAADFETETDRFMEVVLRRLDPLGETELHALWRDVLEERADAVRSAARRLEARLGYDPDEAPATLLASLLKLSEFTGEGAVDEVAPICAGPHPAETLESVISLASGSGIRGRVAVAIDAEAGTMPPWKRGYWLARAARGTFDLGNQPLTDETLAELLQIQADDLKGPSNGLPPAPLGLAVRTGKGEELDLHFRKRNRLARRFEAARFVAAVLSAPGSDRWLPVTDAATARQKLQRAFAAEFLCPIEALSSFLGDEFLPEAFEEAAERFGISEMAIKSHLANHRLIPRELVDSEGLG